jgi:hypothetical protein
MKRAYLISYKSEDFEALNSNVTTYILKLKIVWLWGLFTQFKDVKYSIQYYQPVKPFFDRWDSLIKSGTPLT